VILKGQKPLLYLNNSSSASAVPQSLQIIVLLSLRLKAFSAAFGLKKVS
jgi:hypothetical protein